MFSFVLCIFVLTSLDRGVHGSLADETSQLCCNKGTSYARNHTSEECSSSIPPDVPSNFGSLCIFAMDQCCKEYFQKKRDCENGIDIAMTSRHCGATKDAANICCKDCVSGSAIGAAQGERMCNMRPKRNSAEELLADDAYAECCKKAAIGRDSRHSRTVQQSNEYTSDLASVCEEYAPNELCAHHCIPVPGSYKCECNPGFMLMSDGRNCKEVTKNRCKPHNPCQHKCNDNGVTVKCSCRRGYQLMPDGKSCEDIDECLLNEPVCLPGTQCHNTRGSYKCIPARAISKMERGQCPPGFARNINNGACDDVNECQLPHPPCPSYLCENTIGGYKCGGVTGDPANLNNVLRQPSDDRCPEGFKTGLNEECIDVDECAIRKDDCNLKSQFCINTRGSFYCQDKVSKHCPPGFKINPRTNKCEDINECEDGQDICKSDQICVNVLGEYDCKPKVDVSRYSEKCPEGMRMNPASRICEDIDECVEGTHLCDQYQNCLNTNGSHECHCKLGFQLDTITGACTDVNECATDQHDCIRESQRCDNTVGSYLCIRFTSCGTGYILHHTSGKCEDIDECALGIHNCAKAGAAYQCMNIPGSFRCVRRRSSTTSTTPAPEYEYEYYDSEEEVDNKTDIQPTEKQPEPKLETHSTTTTTMKPKPSSTIPSTTPSTKPTEASPPPDERVQTPIGFPSPWKEDDNTIDNTIDYKTDNASIVTLKEDTDIKPTTTETKHDTTESSTEQKFEQQPEPTYTYYEPKPGEQPSEVVPDTSIDDPRNPVAIVPETTYNPKDSSPKLIYVQVEQETATVKGEATGDGSVVVDTKNVPKNKWTKIDRKPESTPCQSGFEMDEYGACFDIDECATNSHSCSGLTEKCRNTMGGYLCDCAPGFRRDLSTGVCDLITTSTSTTTSTTTPPPIPTVTTPRSPNWFWGYPDYTPPVTRPFRPRNLCDVGFHHNAKTRQCEDINECTNGQANCAAVEICVNTEGGYRCECPPNWKLDEIRHRCIPIRSRGQFPPGYSNEPVYPPVNPEEVIDQGAKGKQYVEPEYTNLGSRGSVIKCPWGYKLGDDNTCEDIDECSTGEAKCGLMQLCVNLPGGYTCSCPRGHKLVEDHQCEDVDECQQAGATPICSHNADCVNTIGSYQCRCHSGFRSAPANDKVCVDVDECTESRSGSLCQHRCNNVWGGYRCSCHRGYRLNPDNSTCADVDECAEFKSKILCVGRCLNEPGSYRCTCPSGYRLSEDKRSCIDIDECETGEATCAKGGTYGGTSDVCLNTRGGYKCHRITCPSGYRLESKHRCTKIDRVCPPADWDCAHQPTTYSYNFITFVSKLYIPASKVDLFTMRGPAWAYAKMKFELKLMDVNAPPTVKAADINAFLLTQTGNQAVVSLVRSLEGPQSIELELSMELYNMDQFGGTAVARLYIHVSEYEF